MPQQVVNGATLMCTMGLGPAVLTVAPVNGVLAGKQPAATIMDHIPLANIGSFGMCISPANPQVAAATAAALGVLTPQPCIPATAAPWTPGSISTKIKKAIPALTNTCTCACNWAGVITITTPGQVSVQET
jgi:hypothetical protein